MSRNYFLTRTALSRERPVAGNLSETFQQTASSPVGGAAWARPDVG